MSKVHGNESSVKIDIQVQTHAPPSYTIKQRGRKTIITINEGAIVITLKPP